MPGGGTTSAENRAWRIFCSSQHRFAASASASSSVVTPHNMPHNKDIGEVEMENTANVAQNHNFSRDDLLPFNLLKEPVWVFDIERKSMWWANKEALKLWNAESLKLLLDRNFSDDMSEATERRLAGYMEKFRRGETVSAQWTYYPNGIGPTTVNVHLSGIRIDGGRLAMLNEGKIVPKDEIDQASLRGVEMLRHLPISVSQFDTDGELMHQNPEALAVFGAGMEIQRQRHLTPQHGSKRSHYGNVKRSRGDCLFRSRFVDRDLGQRIFDDVVNKGSDCCLEAQVYTKSGPVWVSMKVRRSRDPVTGKPSILCSARDITDVLKAKKEAEEANATKSEFMAVMAHELRTPLHQVVGSIDLLSHTSLSTEQDELVNQLQGAGHSLVSIINDLLDYTKLENGQIELQRIPLEARAVVEGAAAAVLGRARQKGLSLKSEFGENMPGEVIGDPNRLRQILLNLLDNAVKFTHHGEIEITANRLDGSKDDGNIHLRFAVRDTGIGISNSFREHVLRRFRQKADTVAAVATKTGTTPRNDGSAGLGLVICERLVKMIGGQIGMESELGKGSTFWFELPFRDPNQHTRRCKIVDNSASASGVDETQRKADSTSAPIGLEVLVAEDNKINQKVVSGMLRRLGHVPTVVQNGKEAVGMAMSKKFDMVLMDVQMPVLDGIEATKEIRSLGIRYPVIGVTATFQRSELERYQQIGMDDCISKPVRLNGLKEKISQLIDERRMQAKDGTSAKD